jgi:protein O-GlcNAc transferase
MGKGKEGAPIARKAQRGTQDAVESPRLFQEAVALHQQGQLASAKALYQELLQALPNHFDSLNLLGVIACQERDFASAVSWLGLALKLNPRYAPAHSNLGYALRNLGRHKEALASYNRALAILPNFPDALSNRAAVLLDLGRYDEALGSCDRALAMAPDSPVLLHARGNALIGLDRHQDAVASYDRALVLNPGFSEACYNRGIALRALARPQDALDSFDRALALNADYVEAMRNRGVVLAELGRHEAAAEQFERLLRIVPDFDYAQGDLLHARMHCCDWRDYEQQVQLIAAGTGAGKPVTMPFVFLSTSDSAADQLTCARNYSRKECSTPEPALWKGERYRHDRIRVAFLSADFRNHAVAGQIAGLIETLDRVRFETVALAFGPDIRDEMTSRLERGFGRFIDVRAKTDRDVARLIKALEIDIAVDLTGYTAGSRPRILAFRPAPVQVNYLGYPGTLGADHIDYIMADRVVIPAEHRACYAEQVVHLPDSFLPYDAGRPIGPDIPTREAAGLPPTGFVFCAFNNSYKISPSMFDVWMRLLRQVEGSVLWLSSGSPAATRNLRRSAESSGIAPDRLVFAPRLKSLADHLARHQLADLMLDNLPYNAHTLASDALWAGLPIVTCAGGAFAGRVAASLLTAAGLPELITGTLDEYAALALALARDPARLSALKAKLAHHRATCPLFDAERYRRHIEAAFQTMWERYQSGDSPRGFAVVPG